MSAAEAGRFVWLSDEYSVPAETICLHEPPAPDRDFRCVRAAGHGGRHEYRSATEAPGLIRDYSHRDPTP